MFKMIPSIFISLILLSAFSCSSLNGKYCYTTKNSSECIDFKQDKKFEYIHWLDIGADKGVGEYDVIDNEVVLNFMVPPIKEEPLVQVKKIKFDEAKDTVGIKNDVVFYDTQNFIKIICLDQQSKEELKIGGVSYYNSNGVNLGRAEYFGKDTININIKYLDFPLTLKFEFSGYLEHQITLNEKDQYFILAELIQNQGFNLTSGQKKFNKTDFLLTEPENYPSLYEKKFIKQK